MIPVVLSLDNLGGGMAPAAASAPAGVTPALGAMSAVGLAMGRLIPRSARTITALAVLVVAVVDT